MILFNVYSDSHNYRIPYKFEDDIVYMFRCFKSGYVWTTETQSFKYGREGMIMFFNDNVDSEGCNNLTKLTRHPMVTKHYYSLMKFIFRDKIK